MQAYCSSPHSPSIHLLPPPLFLTPPDNASPEISLAFLMSLDTLFGYIGFSVVILRKFCSCNANENLFVTPCTCYNIFR
jgi:hypothetical protein